MLGTAQGGLEVSAYSAHRPAANGLTFNAPADWVTFADLTQNSIVVIALDELDGSGNTVPANIPVDLITTLATDKMYTAALGYSAINGDNDGVREKLALIRDAVNDYQSANPRIFFWRATLNGNRLSITSSQANDNHTALALAYFISNVRYYSLGVAGTGTFQYPAPFLASDGNAPTITDYDDAYTIVENEVDLFNLLILPPDKVPAEPHTNLWGPASTFCQQQRAFLLMDAPSIWTTSQLATNGVDALRVGLVKDHSAVFYPRLQINDNGRKLLVGASGAIAGLMARIDGNRGVWKAPAGTEADLRSIIGVEYNFSDRENGVLNPRGINTIRVFPNGIVNWGARTMDGDDDFASEYKYIPVRRLALYMEESLYRGLKWVVFEPNDEPLWAQIRLNVGAFMHNLFRQGAFQGTKKKDAYFVKCDSETTTQNDINLGRVNIWVGFAPLKPAEFVIIYIQQIAGKIQT
ncbi:MAG: phage tail sheath family protein [Bacteroidetes bacterium]|nr:phage tail sheath family protein [Bacteroidota bacterium]MBL7103308.1 phage tail sheath family protein [Bacteroidales bacterium]